MKFAFAFEKLLSHKRTLEDIARRDYMEAKSKVDASMREMDGMYKQIEDSRVRAGELGAAGGTHGPALSQIDEFIKGQQLRIVQHRLKLRELMQEAERLQQILVEAAREKKTLEKLKERRFDEYRARRKKLELKAADEIVTTRFKRTAGES
jgi:flagellar FliJ protein